MRGNWAIFPVERGFDSKAIRGRPIRREPAPGSKRQSWCEDNKACFCHSVRYSRKGGCSRVGVRGVALRRALRPKIVLDDKKLRREMIDRYLAKTIAVPLIGRGAAEC